MTLSELKEGEKAEIVAFLDETLGLLMNEMGFFIGEVVELSSVAPFGDPICIKSEETLLSIRKSDAKFVKVYKVFGQ